MPIDKQALLEQALAQQEEQRAAQQAAQAERAARLESMLQERTQAGTPVDLSALAGLADSMAGTKIAGGVAQQAKAQQGFQGRTDELLDQLNELKGTAAAGSALPLGSLLNDGSEKNTAINGRQQDAQTQAAFKDLADQAKKIGDSVIDAGTNANKMRAAFETKDPRQVMPAMNELARTIQDVKGSMSEGDVNRSFFTDLETKLQIALTKVGSDGKISDDAIAPVIAQLNRFQGKVAEVGKRKAGRLKTTYRGNDAYNAAFNQLQAGGAFDFIDSAISDYEPKEKPAAAPTAPAGGMFGFDPDATLKARTKK